MMPMDLVLVRHGESEGNVANRLSREGDNKHFTQEFRGRHSSSWRLSDLGIKQAKLAGDWIRGNLSNRFDRYYTSEYVRAMETAALLNLPDATWYTEFLLRERDWGELDSCPEDERKAKFAHALAKKDVEPLYWTPPGGVSMADLCLRIDRIIQTLHRECEGKQVIIVCHGEVMWGFRIRIERMSQERYRDLDLSRHPFHHIHNCQILHYSRRNPETGNESVHLDWMRSICPWDTSLSTNDWQEIKRPRCNNNELMARVEKVTRHVAG
jgi:NAD+ kinase